MSASLAGDDDEHARFLPDDDDEDSAGGQGRGRRSFSTTFSNGAAVSSTLKRRVLLMSILFLFIVEFSLFVMEAPLQQIMENFICHGKTMSKSAKRAQMDMDMGDMDGMKGMDPRCKEPDVQQTLAMARSWMMSVSMLVPLLVQIPYGIVADNYGRRIVLFLGLLGVTASTAWNMLILSEPERFSIWFLLLGYIATLIGGGTSVITAMVWTLLTDVIPPEQRSTIFYQLHAMMFVMSIISRPISAYLMSVDPWFPMWIGIAALALGTASSLAIPETLHAVAVMKSTEPENENDDSDNEENGMYRPPFNTMRSTVQVSFGTLKARMAEIWHLIFHSKHLMFLVAALAACAPITIAFEMNILQYMTARFNWTWSKATYISTISKVTSVVNLVVIVPLISRFVSKRKGWSNPLLRDLKLSYVSLGFLLAGSLVIVLTSASWLLITALVLVSLGYGFWSQQRVLLASTVEPAQLATLNTLIGTAETLSNLIGTPLLGWLLSKGIALGGFWMGLPFVFTTFCTIGAAFLLYSTKYPRHFIRDEAL
ncbi:hypothetical protein EsDP_00006465 [Epichloe bromicola]|uniref:Major facilitator superfamily (MFS) profile domain-containing protein n=1 Tax=Epichloe bromicola TaxID=79588 RepID=A0ABQ0CXS5_9HYPO